MIHLTSFIGSFRFLIATTNWDGSSSKRQINSGSNNRTFPPDACASMIVFSDAMTSNP